MKKFTILFAVTFIAVNWLFAQESGLPHNMTVQEKDRWENYQPPQSQRLSEPPPVPVRTMAEWEELQGLMITWTSYYDILAQIVDYAQEEVTVYIVCSDSGQVKAYLYQNGVPLNNLAFLEEDYNSVWCRDYGPWTVYADNTDSLYIIDWIYNRPRPDDDVIPDAFAAYIDVPIYSTTESPDDLTHTGGNFMVDGHGNAFSSELIFEENTGKSEAEIDDIMQRYMGIDRFVKMETLPYDEIHHIDMHMKLLDEETLLVGEYPEGVADGPQIEENLQYLLNNYQTAFGRDYEVVRIPMPPDASGKYPDENGDYRTYTNSVIVNKTVIVPVYEEKYDTTALRIYREAMPGYNVVGIECNDIITALGAIHCITKEVGAENPVWISHARIRRAFETDAGYDVAAVIRCNSGVDSASVYWKTDLISAYRRLKMTPTANDSFVAVIPKQSAGSDVYYYISATSNHGKSIAKPLPAPGGYFNFKVEAVSDVIAAKTRLPRQIRLYPNYPNPFNPSTTIRFASAQSGPITLKIYDMQGREVRTLKSGFMTAGPGMAVWNGTNNQGRPVSSGVYVCQLSQGSYMLHQKMILMK